jgi:hypothetical protein
MRDEQLAFAKVRVEQRVLAVSGPGKEKARASFSWRGPLPPGE